MERNKEELNQLIDRYLAGDCSAEENRATNSYFNQVAADMTDREPDKDIAKRKERVWKRMNIKSYPGTIKYAFRYLVSSAAAIILLVSGWFFLYPGKQNGKLDNTKIQPFKTDIQPGGFGATLTLANGRSIALDSAKLGVSVGQAITYEDGSNVLGKEEILAPVVSLLTASTNKGQTYSFTLPDGTKVWLNADSRLTFPSRFVGNKRKVTLEGEGYFVVKHQVNNSFFVESKGQLVEDLGTAFNIQAYPDESVVKTTLLEGAVKVNTRRIEPGEQTICSSSGDLIVEKADVFKVIAWKQGDFVFRGEPLEEVLRTVARWYDIEVKYDRDDAKRITVGGSISRSKTIRSVLNLMERTGKVRFNVTGRVVTVL